MGISPENNAAQTLEKFLRSKGAKIDTEAFAVAMLDQFGGELGLANELKVLYDSCDSGQLKARLIIAAMDFMNKANYKNPPKPVQDSSSDEELKAIITNVMPGLLGAIHGIQPPPAAVVGGTGSPAGQPPSEADDREEADDEGDSRAI